MSPTDTQRVDHGVYAICLLLLVLVAAGPAEGQAVLAFGPTSIDFDSVAVGSTASDSVLVFSTGNATGMVTNVLPVSGDDQLTATPMSFSLAPGQKQVVTFTFAPTRAGRLTDAFIKLETDAAVAGSTAPAIIVPVTAVATGPRITFSQSRLTFQSLRVGSAVTDSLTIGNAGTESLAVLSLLTTSSAFTTGSVPFYLAPGDSQTAVVTFTPSSTASMVDTLTVLSDSPDNYLSFIALDAIETPTAVRTSRVSLLLTQESATPVIGDSVRVALFMTPNADTIRGVEVFVGFDNTLLDPVGEGGPIRRLGLSEGFDFQINVVEDPGTTYASAHFSTFFGKDIRAADSLAVIVFEVLADIRDETSLRVLTENPLRNSNYLSPDNLLFAIPGSLGVSLSNRTPRIEPFGILAFDEDTDLTFSLAAQAFDTGTPSNSLSWVFVDNQNLFTVGVESSVNGQTLRVTPPENAFGVFDLLVIVTDDGGASDSAAVILDVRPINDPPNAPVYTAPPDSSENLESSVNLRWTGDDDEGDSVTFEVRLGTTLDGLQPVATNLEISEHTAEGLGAGSDYFWQVVTVDKAGARKEGAIQRFSTAPDESPPIFVSAPGEVDVTPTSIRIVWETDETSTSMIRLGLQATLSDSVNFGQQGSDVFLVLRHDITIEALQPSTTYFYRATSQDLDGNTASSPIRSFTTLEPAFILGDFDYNRVIEFDDFLQFALTFNSRSEDAEYNALADFDGNALIDFSDFLAFAAIFGESF